MTQGKQISRLVLLNLALACGNHSRYASLPQGGMGYFGVSCEVNEGTLLTRSKDRFPDRYSKRSAEAQWGCQARPFQGLRVTNMTKNETARATIPHQDTRNLSWSAWLSSPRGAIKNKSRREFAQIRRNRHGFARAIENLRRVRLSLVPRPDPRERLLPSV